MSKAERFKSIIFGIFTILFGLIILAAPDQGYLFVLILLSFSAIIKGIRLLIYYFTMARYMVGGKIVLYEGMVFLDFGMITRSLTDIPKPYIMVYLIVVLIFKGAIDIMRAFEAKSLDAPLWKYSLAQGIVCIVIPVISLFMHDNIKILIYAFVFSTIYSGITRIISAFKKTSVLYIR